MANSYIPYVTALPAGAITRDTRQLESAAIGRLVNFTSYLYASDTGYTQQHYNNAGVYTPQFQAWQRLNNINRLTPAPISYSNKPRDSIKAKK